MRKCLLIWIILIASWFITLTQGERSTLNHSMQLLDDLMDHYDSRLRPVYEQFEEVKVNMNFSLEMIRSFDDVSGEISLLGTFEINWLEERLQWTPDNYGNITNLILPKTEVWHPELFLKTSLDRLSQPGTAAKKISVTYDGKAKLTSTDVLTSVCPVDVQNYPDDFQTCSLTTIPTGYSVNEIRLGKSRSVIHNIPANNEWNILEIVTSTDRGEFDIIIKLQRRNMYGLMTMKIPIHLLGVLNCWVFFLPPESGERTSYSITTFLAFTVYMGIVTDNMPKGSMPVANLMFHVFIMLIYSSAILFCTIISLQIHTNQGKKPVPNIIQKITKILSFHRCLSRKVKVSSQGKLAESEIKRPISAASQKPVVSSKRFSLRRYSTGYFAPENLPTIPDTDCFDTESPATYFPQNITEQNTPYSSSNEDVTTWTHVGNVFDAYMLLLFLLLFTIVSVFYNTMSLN